MTELKGNKLFVPGEISRCALKTASDYKSIVMSFRGKANNILYSNTTTHSELRKEAISPGVTKELGQKVTYEWL